MLKITIIDTDTNETIIDAESKCIIGAIKIGQGAQAIACTRANALEISETMVAASKAQKELLEDEEVRMVYSILNFMKKMEEPDAE